MVRPVGRHHDPQDGGLDLDLDLDKCSTIYEANFKSASNLVDLTVRLSRLLDSRYNHQYIKLNHADHQSKVAAGHSK